MAIFTVFNFSLLIGFFILETAISLALVLTLNRYDIKENWRKISTTALFLGLVAAISYYLPQLLRFVSLCITFFFLTRYFIGFTTGKAVIILFTNLLVTFLGQGLPALIFHYCTGVSTADMFNFPLIHLLFRLSYNTPLAIFTFISYRKGWHIFLGTPQVKIPFKTIFPPVVQLILLGATANEYFFSSRFEPATRLAELLILTILAVSTLVSLFFLWRMLSITEQEAAAAANKKMSEEMRDKVDAARLHRHDFINHVQVMIALLREDRKKEFASYLEAIKKGI